MPSSEALMTAGRDEAAPRSRGYRVYVLVLLCLTFFLSYADRQIFGVLLTPLKKEFDLSDTVLGLMSGLGFGLFYGAMSLPLARWADRSSRKNVLTLCLGLWSVATMLSGAASSTVHLFLARASVGIGEAGGTPSGISIISDLFGKARRGLAIGMYNAAGSFGGAAVITIGAWVASEHSWRMAFVVVGIPGILLTLLIAFTVEEPARGAADGIVDVAPPATAGQTFRHILGQPALVLTMVGGGMSSAVVACTAWLPSFFERSHGLSLVQAGGAVGLALLLAGPFGEILGGQATDRLSSRGNSAILWSVLATTVVTIVMSMALMTAPSAVLAIAAMVGWKIFATAFPPPTWSLSQSMVPPGMRATSQATMGIFSNLLGYGGGPSLAGWLSEVYRPAMGDESLRWGLGTTMLLMGTGASVAYVFAARAAGRSATSDL